MQLIAGPGTVVSWLPWRSLVFVVQRGQPGPCRCLGGTELFLAEVLLVPGHNKAKFEGVLREIKRFRFWEFLKPGMEAAVPSFCMVCG